MPRFDHVSGKHLQIEDARIYVEETGDPAGQPLVLLHGGLGHMADFNILLDLFPHRSDSLVLTYGDTASQP